MRPERHGLVEPTSALRRVIPASSAIGTAMRPEISIVHAVMNGLRMVRRSPIAESVAEDGDDHGSAVRCDPVFPDEDSLPGPQLTAPFIDRDAEGGLGQDRADVRGHVVGAFEVVDELRIAVRHEPFGEVFEIPPYGRVGVLADDQRRAGVLDEEIAQSTVDARSADDLLDLPGDLVRPGRGGSRPSESRVEPCVPYPARIRVRRAGPGPVSMAARLNRT